MTDTHKKQLETQLWNIANTLRGKMNADEFRDYILGFIFYKYLSEQMHLYANKILKEDGIKYEDIDGDTDEGQEYLEAIKEEAVLQLGYFLKPSELFHAIAKRGNGNGKKKFILDDLTNILNNIEQSTMGTDSEDDFDKLFEDLDLTSTKLGRTENAKNELISKVLSHLDRIDFQLENTELDILGDAYEYLIGQFASGAGKKAGEFYTPQEVSRVLAKLVTTGKTKLKSVYDPTCGSGSLLLRVAKEVKAVSAFYGQELNRTTYNLARMNMILHGVHYRKFDIRQEDTLERPQHIDERFEAIVANPPFSAKWSANPLHMSDDRFSQYGKLAPKTKADFAFVQHMIHQLAENGQMAVVLPHGTLFRGSSEKHIFCVSNIDTLIKYYKIFREKKEDGQHDLRIATIFSYTANEEDKDADGLIGEPDFDIKEDTINKHSRDNLDDFINDYNEMYKTKFSTKDSQSFYNYYKDIAKRVKDREKVAFQDKNRVDILLVVNMFLTGFDAKKVNTLYVDKNLKHHGLIQAFSRTNRIINEIKSYGNIICFRNLKKSTDDAIALFSDREAKEVILMQPYEVYTDKFNKALERLKEVAPTVDSVNELPSEDEELEFVKAFRGLMRLKNLLSGFSDFEFEDLDMDEQEFEDYKSKYLDIYDKVKNETAKEKVSILDDVDFELELIHRDEINVSYILRLLGKLHEANEEEKEKQRKIIIDLLGGEAQLRSKKELIEKFINENLPLIEDADDIPDEFSDFWNREKVKALNGLCKDENLIQEKLFKIIDTYLFTGRKPLRDTVVDALKVKPKLLQRKKIVERVIAEILNFVNTFDENMGGI